MDDSTNGTKQHFIDSLLTDIARKDYALTFRTGQIAPNWG